MKCQYCPKETTNKGGLVAHELTCSLNPNRIRRHRSPLAGLKKGSVPWNKGLSIGRQSSWDVDYPLEKVMVVNSTYSRHCLKKRIIDNQLIPYKCACCGLEPIWNGKPLALILDHINGINNDNRLKNLRFVCSNCDSQLETYKSKNRKVARAGRN